MPLAKVRDNGTGQFTNVATTTTFAFTMTNGYTAGDLIAVWVHTNANTTAAVTDTLSNTYTAITAQADAAGTHITLLICFSATAGTPTLTVTTGTACAYCIISVSEWSGGGSAVDKSASATQTTANPATAATTTATTSANELVLLAWSVYTTPVQAQTATTPAGYTALPSINSTSTNNFFYLFPFYKIVSATGTMGGDQTTLGFAPSQTNSIVATVAAIDSFPAGFKANPRVYLRT